MITQRFPFLLPLRIAQRKVFFYTGMRFDGRTYAKTKHDAFLAHKLFSTSSGLYNTKTGFDMVYQENKVFNLKLAAKALNGLCILPGETFSLWKSIRSANRHTPYRDGLTVTNGKLETQRGGGLCQMSNLLFWVFLHSPLTIVERHAHGAQDFPSYRNDEPEGVDATISEGWLDLKVGNETDRTFQIGISFDSENIIGTLFTDRPMPCHYVIEGRDLSYFEIDGEICQEISIYRREHDPVSGELLSEYLLYTNQCVIGYPLPGDTLIIEKRGS